MSTYSNERLISPRDLVQQKGLAGDAVEAATPNGLVADQRKPALDKVEPRGAARSEVQMEAPVSGEPLVDCGLLRGSVVVADEVQLTLEIVPGQRLRKGDELQSGCDA